MLHRECGKVCPGASLGNNVIVGIGSVVTKCIETSNALVAGHPAKIIKEHYDWKSRGSRHHMD